LKITYFSTWSIQTKLFVISLLWGGLGYGCKAPEALQENQYLLISQSVEGSRAVPYYELEAYYVQKPNGKFLFLFSKAAMYERGARYFSLENVKKRYDSTESLYNRKIFRAEDKKKENKVGRLKYKRKKKLDKISRIMEEGNWLMRVGEKPAYFDSLAAVRTAGEMEKHLRQKGFFQAKVYFKTKNLFSKRKRVTYYVTENLPTYLGKIDYLSSSLGIDTLIKETLADGFLKEKDRYDEAKIDAERGRIELLLKNNGYMYFNRQYITFHPDTNHFQTFAKPDSIFKNNTFELARLKDTTRLRILRDSLYALPRIAPMRVEIGNPIKGTHTAYRIDAVYLHQIIPSRRRDKKDTLQSIRSDIQYIYTGRSLKHGYQVLDRRIKIRPGQVYSKYLLDETQRSLSLLDMYKFVRAKEDTLGSRLLVNIYTTPVERYQLSDEVGLNYAQGGLPGPYVNVSLKNRNTFGGAEIFENSIRFLIDGQASFAGSNNFYSSQEIGINSALTFPQLLFPRALIYRRLRENIDKYNPSTRLALGYNFTRRPEYTRSNLSASITYKGQLNRATYNLTLAELSVVNTTDIASSFQEQLIELQNEGNSIINSFDRALVSSIYFIYTFNSSADNQKNRSHYFRILLEGGGLTLNLLRQSRLRESDRIFGLRYFQFWRVNPSYHYYLPIANGQQMIALRLNAGMALPYGNSNTLPYEKFYFVGGSNSIRAWRPRRLGPGASRPTVESDGTFDYKFERPGELMLEANLEYRFPLVSVMRGALFLDIGNVWTLQTDAANDAGRFKLNRFWEQFAIGSGFGIRFNFPFILVRTDIGMKLYDPARTAGRRWVVAQFKPWEYLKKDIFVFNLAIGYPF
jgi:outer membrane protein assembly factor BamA